MFSLSSSRLPHITYDIEPKNNASQKVLLRNKSIITLFMNIYMYKYFNMKNNIIPLEDQYVICNTYKWEKLSLIYLFICSIFSIGSEFATVLNIWANTYWLYICRQWLAANIGFKVLNGALEKQYRSIWIVHCCADPVTPVLSVKYLRPYSDSVTHILWLSELEIKGVEFWYSSLLLLVTVYSENNTLLLLSQGFKYHS